VYASFEELLFEFGEVSCDFALAALPPVCRRRGCHLCRNMSGISAEDTMARMWRGDKIRISTARLDGNLMDKLHANVDALVISAEVAFFYGDSCYMLCLASITSKPPSFVLRPSFQDRAASL
jgi:hypothetical protein